MTTWNISNTALYVTDNGRTVCGQHCGGAARATGRDLSGQKILRVDARYAKEWQATIGAPVACEDCGREYEGTDLETFLATLPEALSRKGPKYAPDVAIAKRIRAELAAGVTSGVFPAHTGFSVRIEHHASLSVEIVQWHGAVFSSAYEEHLMDPKLPWNPKPTDARPNGWRRSSDARHSAALAEAVWAAEAIANRHNYDDSDSRVDHFDVGYYLNVDARTVEALAERAIRLQFDAGFARLVERAAAAATAVGSKVSRAVLRTSFDAANEHALARLVKLAERAAGRPLAYDKRRGWVVAPATDVTP